MRGYIKGIVCVLSMSLFIATLSACKGKDVKPQATEEPVATEVAEAVATEEAVADTASPEPQESAYDTYTNTIVGLKFDYTKGLYVVDNVPAQMSLMSRLSEKGILKEGKPFDIYRMQTDTDLQIVTLSAKDKADTTFTVALTAYANAEDVAEQHRIEEELARKREVEARGELYVAPTEDPEATEEPIREIALDEAFIADAEKTIHSTITDTNRNLSDEIVSNVINIGTEEKPVNILRIEYSYVEATTSDKYDVAYVVFPCGKNLLSIYAVSKDVESTFDKIDILEVMANSLAYGKELVTVGASELSFGELDTNTPADANKPAVEIVP